MNRTIAQADPTAREILQAADELARLKEQHGITTKPNLFERASAQAVRLHDAVCRTVLVDKKRYCQLCWLGLFGVHQFYAGHWIKGLLYLLLCWTGISVGMTFVDWMIAFPKHCDGDGRIAV